MTNGLSIVAVDPHLLMLDSVAIETLCEDEQSRSCCLQGVWSLWLVGRCGSFSSRWRGLLEPCRCHSALPRPTGKMAWGCFTVTKQRISILYLLSHCRTTFCKMYLSICLAGTLKIRMSLSDESCLKACFHGMENSVCSRFVHWTPGYLQLSICVRSHGMSSCLEWDIPAGARKIIYRSLKSVYWFK